MDFNFKKAAQEQTSLSPIMVGKEKLETEDIIGKKLTITGFDFAPKFDKSGHPIVDESTGEVDTFGVVVFKEHPGKYYCVGTVFTKVCKTWVAPFNGNAEEASKALSAAGGVVVKFSSTKTRAGNNLTSVEILE